MRTKIMAGTKSLAVFDDPASNQVILHTDEIEGGHEICVHTIGLTPDQARTVGAELIEAAQRVGSGE